ncbi:MAG: glutamine synthetase [Acidimicrobiia bacterium]|nr:glutamine synthetase family protein [Acidimicrobiia bacterium]NNF09020.1 glutamine synthetase [Acidimicrobiia bacterium]NNL69009.1 glutamine synthetase [Acidimicrobiia bacterium]
MNQRRGMLSIEALRDRVSEGAIDTVVVGFTDHYGRLMGKRFDAEFFLDEAAAHGTHACDYLLTVDMEMEPVPGYEFAGWDLGYGDFHVVPDIGTLRTAAWLDRTALVLCDVAEQNGDAPVPVAPRSILARQVERAAELGFTAMGASELEYYTYEESYRQAARQRHNDLTPLGWYIEDYHLLQGMREEPLTATARRHLNQSGVPIETSKGEWGRGQHEINVRYAEVMEMADRHVVLKQCLKETAESLGMSVTFMAKPFTDEAGSSCHLHLSLWADGANAFAGDGSISEADLFRWFLAGWLAHAPEVLVFYAPTVNSYKRFQDSSWAPTRLAWSMDNRTAAMRVVGSGPSLRIECRLPGADTNPYLAFAAALASGLDGIEQQLEPPPVFTGNAYDDTGLASVARDLGTATGEFRESAFARSAFGDAVVDHYAHFFEQERLAYRGAVTDWERARYFDRI